MKLGDKIKLTIRGGKPMTNYNERLDEILNSEYGVLHCCGDYQGGTKPSYAGWQMRL